MPRKSRQWVPGAGAHVISRFVDRRYYLVDDVDRRSLVNAITLAQHRWDWVWLSYASMSSHFHGGLLAGVVPPGRFFQSSNTRFAQRYHAREGRDTLGPVFADRPTIHPTKNESLHRLVAYHHRNPVEAGVVQRASESTWTSHRAYLRLDRPPSWLDIERCLDLLGFSDTAGGRREFDEFVMELDIGDFARGAEPGLEGTLSRMEGADAIDWRCLVTHARAVAGIAARERLNSRSHRAARTRRLIAIVATADLGQTYAAVARRLEMSTGGVHNLATRRSSDAGVQAMLCELRRRLAGNDEMDELRPPSPASPGGY